MDPFIGQVILFAGNFPPRGWAFCEGQILPINQNQSLYSILGTTYGGDGRTTFALPDLRGRVPVGHGNGPGLPPVTLGEKTGTPTTTLTAANLPNTPVSIPASGEDANADEPSGKAMAVANSSIYGSPSSNSHMAPGRIDGQSASFNNMQPTIATNYIIALQGVFPPRN